MGMRRSLPGKDNNGPSGRPRSSLLGPFIWRLAVVLAAVSAVWRIRSLQQ